MITTEKIRELYDNEVSERIRYNYHSSEKSYQYFELAANFVNDNDYDPMLFIKAIFDYVWYTHTDRGFKRLEYPYPKMLCSKKAEWIYNKYLSKYAGKPQTSSIMNEVSSSVSVMKKLKLSDELCYDLYLDLYDEGRISIYYLVLDRGFNTVYNNQLVSGNIPIEFKKNFDSARRFIYNLPSDKFNMMSSLVRGINGK
jgi:hypothetical protein